MEIPERNSWKIAENRTLKWGSSPPPSRAVELSTFKCLMLNDLRSKTLGQIQNLVPHRLMSRLNPRPLRRHSSSSAILLSTPGSKDGCRWWTTRPSGEGRAASASTVFDPLVEFLQCHAKGWIRLKFRIPAQSFRYRGVEAKMENQQKSSNDLGCWRRMERFRVSLTAHPIVNSRRSRSIGPK
jgi:hypothetical protein